MKPIEIISQDVFEKIRSRFQNLEMGDEAGAITLDPGKARFFDFDFIYEGHDLGRVSISINDLGSLKIFYSKGITEGKEDIAKQIWYKFLKEMRMFAMRRLLRFDTRDISKSNLDKNDFQYLASKKQKDEEMKQMNESRWNHRSSKKTSRAVKGRTQVIVRHSKSVDETRPTSRSQRKNIKAIFIESPMGERYLYPFIHPAGAFAMAQHVDHGGIPHDPAGKAIIKMSEQIAQLQEFGKQVQRTTLHDDAMQISNRANMKLVELKKMIESLGTKRGYQKWMAEQDETEYSDEMPDDIDLDPVTMEEYKTKFTQTNFKEELSKFFPLLHKIMQETNKIDLDDYVKEGSQSEFDQNSEQSTNAFEEFTKWAEDVERGELTDDEKQNLKQELDNLQVPLELDTAYEFFSNLGIKDEELENAFDLEQQRPDDLKADALTVFKTWAKDQDKQDLLDYLEINEPEEQPQAATTQPAAAAPATPQEPAPAQPAAAPPVQPAAEARETKISKKGSGNIVKEVAKIVNQFYNKEHKEQGLGPFPKGEEGICLEVQKRISEMFGDEAGKKASELAGQFMQKIVNQESHHNVDDDGLSRLKEITNKLKQRVETMGGDIGDGEKAFNNIMPAEDISEMVRLAGLAK